MLTTLSELFGSDPHPPYAVVVDSRKIGIENPEDQQWHWIPFDQKATSQIKRSCPCSPTSRLVILKAYIGDRSATPRYLMWVGQCSNCRVVYWTQAPGTP